MLYHTHIKCLVCYELKVGSLEQGGEIGSRWGAWIRVGGLDRCGELGTGVLGVGRGGSEGVTSLR